MTDEVLLRHGTTMVGRLVLEAGETMPWQRDPFHRVAVALGGDLPTFLAPHNSFHPDQAAVGRRCPATARIASSCPVTFCLADAGQKFEFQHGLIWRRRAQASGTRARFLRSCDLHLNSAS